MAAPLPLSPKQRIKTALVYSSYGCGVCKLLEMSLPTRTCRLVGLLVCKNFLKEGESYTCLSGEPAHMRLYDSNAPFSFLYLCHVQAEGLTAVEMWVVSCIIHVFAVLAEYAVILKLIQENKISKQ